MNGTSRCWQLRGDADAVRAAVDRLLVWFDPVGIHETEHQTSVYLPAALVEEEVLSVLRPVQEGTTLQVDVFAVPAEEFTGLERDLIVEVDTGLRVRPPWVQPGSEAPGIELVVPRGMAFGSGEHESTRAALCIMHRCWREAESLLDVGCGSGILAAYGQARNVANVLACDIEGPAVRAVRELLPQARVVRGPPEAFVADLADTVVANMTGAELSASWPAIVLAWNRRSLLVLSGLKLDEAEPFLSRVLQHDCVLVGRHSIGAFTAFGFVSSSREASPEAGSAQPAPGTR